MIVIISLRFTMVIGLTLVNGCAPVYLHHPETGKTVKCGSYFEDPASDHSAKVLKRACIESYEREGYDQKATVSEAELSKLKYFHRDIAQG
jgi:hypothetical protein